jgi:DNA-directed RNA polymerase specialized sigma24 family protein
LSGSLPLTEQNRDSAPEPESGPTLSGDVSHSAPDSEPPSLREVFDEHAPFVWRTLRHLGIRDADLPDVCQEVFVAVHRKLEGFEGRSSLRTWLYGICLRTASDHRRRAYVRRERAPWRSLRRARSADAAGDYGQARRLLAELLESSTTTSARCSCSTEIRARGEVAAIRLPL